MTDHDRTWLIIRGIWRDPDRTSEGVSAFAEHEETPTVLRKGSLRLPNMKRPRPYFGRGLSIS